MILKIDLLCLLEQWCTLFACQTLAPLRARTRFYVPMTMGAPLSAAALNLLMSACAARDRPRSRKAGMENLEKVVRCTDNTYLEVNRVTTGWLSVSWSLLTLSRVAIYS